MPNYGRLVASVKGIALYTSLSAKRQARKNLFTFNEIGGRL